VSGGLAAVADRMAEAVREAAAGDHVLVLGNGYGGFVALQMAIRHPGVASRLILADSGAAFSEAGREAFRNMAGPRRPRGWRRSPRSRCADYSRGISGGASRSDARPPRGVSEHRCGGVSRGLQALATLDLRPELAKVKVLCW